MVERLITSLRALAALAEVAPGRAPSSPASVEALARDFEDAHRLVSDCPQLDLTPAQRVALRRVDECLEGLDGAAWADGSAGAAPRAAPEWAALRRLARDALDLLDALDAPAAPPPGDAGRGRRETT